MVARKKILVLSLACLGAVGGLAWVADSAVAIRAERAISTAVADNSNLEVQPHVYLGGVPYTQALLSGEIPRLSVEALDVDTPGLGLVNARTEITAIEASGHQVFSGDLTGATAEVFSRQLGLDGVAVGEQLGMTDLDISNPYDISPGGGPAVEVQLTGTPHGFTEPVTVIAALRLEGPSFRMTPFEFPEVPADRIEEARRAFSWELDTRSLPLAGQAEAVHVSGGSIYFTAQRRNITVEFSDLSPLETSNPSDYDDTDYGRHNAGS
ncbi:LmeA family phospholipid-binding protein [Corynebacterium lowii]|uniref:DUF2993 domain-containing protein n=1 Tax=Corynebacterium lowii TaxID=1544413 RepID=A0A0Q0TY15_9CORY|nr:DUF2993 domain-containing protein [Corynebacterium lowii]KQB83961.1 hypothetical protein Clow_02162 [Corynebacterium lowii]MDP9852789.1 hypothetical protein [Corynebacterium lowii]